METVMTKTLTVSQPNINGDSRQTLIDELHTSITSLTKAIENVREMTIHGRNFQTLQDGAHKYAIARIEQENRITALFNVREELFALLSAIHDNEITIKAHVLPFANIQGE